MHKTEIIKEIASKTGLSIKDAKRGLDTTLHIIRETLKKGDRVILIGLGTFTTTKRKERTTKSLNTGKMIKVKAKKVVKFKAGKAFSEIVKKAK